MSDYTWSMTEPKKVIEYKIIEGFSSSVENEVNSLLKDDWEPYGKMCIMKAPGGEIDIIIQCMVLYKKPVFC